ncbi:MAG: Bifunctional riboflavin kinase/FMN adenylyltransferase [Chroococcidiopsis cubana SAG 39.79]|uniref:Riboflavin biosynthesis protein n=2 Tax=Chroococcidiopsis TaxID=54298 RepID=K9TYV9_CHRTP|nr:MULTISPECIES: bifunctional riboflavin kinase/FAD synthetase [Chroococcidiopsis]AFY87573.1 FMN adenylyltransferase, riboflavin kinase [Chroococcidiopsis thermalis PCC 7203]MDZ4874907.1 Bifunctional riboflavin kinase/FMN adenylyltransferase [Chroococcidiopsis cubana SAG 39.79]PSB66299.1 bifunctional riboflavin kinase/FAD synthetase [Chroococcidiopsis cubana CCALA 043]RUT12385.1 riboflavin biosynthesis protein [Chroococcidiopsis cubana SAG 39.79]
MWITESTTNALTPTAVALGNFDGLHRGHQQVIQPVVKNSEFGSQNSELTAFHSTVVTFNPHPQEFFSGQSRQLLTPLPEKVQQLSSWGIEQLVLLPFNRELAALSPEDFVEQILVQQLQAKTISIGQDFRFGKQRSGTATDLQAIAARFGIPVAILPNYNCEGERISSSAIRQALTEGNVKRAELLLARPYTLQGKVVKGQQLGRTIGFPTANIELPENKFLPRLGVYAVRVLIEGERHDGQGRQGRQGGISNDEFTSCLLPLASGVMNLGYRPTVNGIGLTVEVHLFDWSGDLYGKAIAVQLEEFIRAEKKFASLDELKAQIAADSAKARNLLSPDTTHEKVN